MKAKIAELLSANRLQQSIINTKIKEKREMVMVTSTQGFFLLVLLLICTVNLFLNFGLLLAIANLGVIVIAIKKIISIDEISETLIQAKEILHSNPKMELENLRIEEVLLQEMQMEVQNSTIGKRNERMEQLKRAREFLLKYQSSQMTDMSGLEMDSREEIEKAKTKVKISRKGML